MRLSVYLGCVVSLLMVIAIDASSTPSSEQTSQAAQSATPASLDTIVLTKRNFARLVSKGRSLFLAYFYLPNDAQSDYTAPIVDVLATHLKGLIQVGKVNCVKQQEICQYFRIKGNGDLPLLLMFKAEPTDDPSGFGYLGEGAWAGKDPVPCDLPNWEPDKVADWAMSFLHTRNILRVTFRNLDEFHAIKNIPKLFYFSDTNNKPEAIIQALSINFEKRMLFALVKYDEIRVQKKFGIEAYPSLMILDDQWRMQHYGGKADPASIAKWVSKYALKERMESFSDPFTVKYKFDKYKEEL